MDNWSLLLGGTRVCGVDSDKNVGPQGADATLKRYEHTCITSQTLFQPCANLGQPELLLEIHQVFFFSTACPKPLLYESLKGHGTSRHARLH